MYGVHNSTNNSQSSNFDNFYADLKQTELTDSFLTPAQQIDRLLRPGHTYRNLNPYDVLQVEPDDDFELAKKKFRRLSILIHPDKNLENVERARQAFDWLKKAFALLEDENERKNCYELVEEARFTVKRNADTKRNDMISKGFRNVQIDEDDPCKLKKAVEVETMKLFANRELKRRSNEQKISDDAAKKRQAELKAEEKTKLEDEFKKNFEETRQGRVNSWLDFSKGIKSSENGETLSSPCNTGKSKKSKKRFTPLGFRPPKTKPETR